MRARVFSDDFKSDAVNLIFNTGKPLAQVARDLGINHWTLREWYRKEVMARNAHKKAANKGAKQAPATETPEEKLQRLERENAALRKEIEELKVHKDILKKAAAFFAKESE